MIEDLNSIENTKINIKTQVCIIGGGTAGIFLANLLNKNDIKTVLLEAGNLVAAKPETVDQLCEQHGVNYRGASSGRSFGIGGTSVLWGGQMLPLTTSDIGDRSKIGFEGWPITYNEISKYFPIVENSLQISKTTGSMGYEDVGLEKKYSHLKNFSKKFTLRLSLWIPFGRRNFYRAFENALINSKNLNVWLNASVTELVPVKKINKTTINKVIAKNLNGKSIEVETEIVVICAGTLESTRLLLEYDLSTQNSITRSGSPLGNYFTDHISMTCGKFLPHNHRRFMLEMAPIFDNGIMRTPRLELAGSTQNDLRLTSAFAHFTFTTNGKTGLDIIRNILRKKQGESFENKINLNFKYLFSIIKELTCIVFWKFFYKKLWIPKDAKLSLQIDIEQIPNVKSSLTLSNLRDKLNRRRLAINWKIGSEDISNIEKVAELFVDGWNSSIFKNIADLEITLPKKITTYESLYDVYHPTGTIRMGYDASSSVVNGDLRLWAIDNCFVSSTAVFPSAGSANPGLTHLALTTRLSEHINEYFSNSDC